MKTSASFRPALILSMILALNAVPAFANLISSGAETGSPGGAFTSPVVGSSTSQINKMAIVVGQRDAVQVLNGGEATDLFRAARKAAESLTGETFESDQDAAAAIVDLAESRNNTTMSSDESRIFTAVAVTKAYSLTCAESDFLEARYGAGDLAVEKCYKAGMSCCTRLSTSVWRGIKSENGYCFARVVYRGYLIDDSDCVSNKR